MCFSTLWKEAAWSPLGHQTSSPSTGRLQLDCCTTCSPSAPPPPTAVTVTQVSFSSSRLAVFTYLPGQSSHFPHSACTPHGPKYHIVWASPQFLSRLPRSLELPMQLPTGRFHWTHILNLTCHKHTPGPVSPSHSSQRCAHLISHLRCSRCFSEHLGLILGPWLSFHLVSTS